MVVLRLRGRTSLGATFFVVVADFARRVAEAGGRLYLSGLDAEVAEGLRRTGRVDVTGPVRLYEAAPIVGSSTEQAYDAATTWAVGHAREHP